MVNTAYPLQSAADFVEVTTDVSFWARRSQVDLRTGDWQSLRSADGHGAEFILAQRSDLGLSRPVEQGIIEDGQRSLTSASVGRRYRSSGIRFLKTRIAAGTPLNHKG